jgi:hypothetical protein
LLSLRTLGTLRSGRARDSTGSRERERYQDLAEATSLPRLHDPQPAMEIPLPIDADARVENAAILRADRCRGSEQHAHHEGCCGWGKPTEDRRA